jgi:glycosyltransferase involved in cell wall biosynthesis
VRVLFVTCHLPYPPMSGGRRREWELLRRVGSRHEVDVCAVTKTYADDAAYASEVEQVCTRVSLFEAVSEDDPDLPLQVARHRSVPASAAVAWGAGAYDVVHLEGFYLAQHLPRQLRTPVALTEQNVEFTLWQQRARIARGAEERRRFARQAELTRAHELTAWSRSAVCAALTEEDRELMARSLPGNAVELVPDGADHSAPSTTPTSSGDRTVVMVGNFAYEPNVDAALFLCREIAPLLTARVPGVRILLVGNAPPDTVRAAAAATGCTSVTGTVPAIEPYLDEADVVLCPLRIGGGVKVKVLEALSRGKAVVATPVAAQGLGSAGRDAMRIADAPDALATAAAELIENASSRRRLEHDAAHYARTLPCWDDAAHALERCWTMAAGEPAGVAAAAG